MFDWKMVLHNSQHILQTFVKFSLIDMQLKQRPGQLHNESAPSKCAQYLM